MTNEQAFPVRVRVLVPRGGFFAFGSDNDVWSWLRQRLGLGNFATTACLGSDKNCIEVHFRNLGDAAAFRQRFPILAQADAVMDGVGAPPSAHADPKETGSVCRSYSHLGSREALERMIAPRSLTNLMGNSACRPQIVRDDLAPILRRRGTNLQLVTARWGMPTPPQHLAGRKLDNGVTIVHDMQAAHWGRWEAPASRCLVPFNAFVQRDPGYSDGRNVRLRIIDDRPTFFAGIWTSWTSVRKLEAGRTTDQLFAILAVDANEDVSFARQTAMPMILTRPDDWDVWLKAPWRRAKLLQRSPPPGLLAIAADLVQ